MDVEQQLLVKILAKKVSKKFRTKNHVDFQTVNNIII